MASRNAVPDLPRPFHGFFSASEKLQMNEREKKKHCKRFMYHHVQRIQSTLRVQVWGPASAVIPLSQGWADKREPLGVCSKGKREVRTAEAPCTTTLTTGGRAFTDDYTACFLGKEFPFPLPVGRTCGMPPGHQQGVASSMSSSNAQAQVTCEQCASERT
jgi:hypothetical protein